MKVIGQDGGRELFVAVDDGSTAFAGGNNVIYHNENGEYMTDVNKDHREPVGRELEAPPEILSRFMPGVHRQTGPEEAQLGKLDNTPRERHQFNPRCNQNWIRYRQSRFIGEQYVKQSWQGYLKRSIPFYFPSFTIFKRCHDRSSL